MPVQRKNMYFPETHELGLGPKWAEEYLEQSIDIVQDDINKNDVAQTIKDDDPNFAYSKFMKFMKQEGDIPIESKQTLLNLDDASEEWVEQYINRRKTESTEATNVNDNDTILNKVEEELEAAGTWVNEYEKDSLSTGIKYRYTYKYI